MKFTITTLNDNGSGMKYDETINFIAEIWRMAVDCEKNGGTRFDVTVDSDASCFLEED